jgi:DMSO/TMAO reductase YedYZ molybdopterin-dependent catalytic subunit
MPLEGFKELLMKIIMVVVVAILLCGAAVGTWMIVSDLAGKGTIENAEELQAIEIREYEGTDLSSIVDFRENSIKGPQYVDIDNYRLKVSGLVENPASYTINETINNYQNYKKVVTLHCVEGWSVTILWEGVLLSDLIQEVVLSPNAITVVFHAYDGYTTSLPIDYIMDEEIILAYKMNGVPLPPERGAPFQLVAESKWGYKWIKWVTEIEISDNTDYKGYWERRGYSNDADLFKR